MAKYQKLSILSDPRITFWKLDKRKKKSRFSHHLKGETRRNRYYSWISVVHIKWIVGVKCSNPDKLQGPIPWFSAKQIKTLIKVHLKRYPHTQYKGSEFSENLCEYLFLHFYFLLIFHYMYCTFYFNKYFILLTQNHSTPTLLYPLKTSRNVAVSWCFQGV